MRKSDASGGVDQAHIPKASPVPQLPVSISTRLGTPPNQGKRKEGKATMVIVRGEERNDAQS